MSHAHHIGAVILWFLIASNSGKVAQVVYMTEFVIYTMRENGRESGYRRKVLKNILKKQPHFDFSTKVRLVFTLFLFADDFC